jgi:hypothetical protein
MINNIYKHNSRSYYDIYNALVAAYPQKPTWLFKEMAGFFDFQSELMNRIATDILYPTTREAAYAFAATCDYSPTEADGATVELTITLTTAKAKTLAIGYQVAGSSTATGKTVIYELTETGNSGGTATITVDAKQKKTFTNKLVATIDNTDDFADYYIDGYTKIIKSSVSLTINSETWYLVNNFDNSTASDRHFVLIYQSSGKCRIGFGDGITGVKPTIGSAVYATFETTEGSLGMMDIGEITINTGGDNDISAITNAAASTGGNDAESISAILRNARGTVRLRDIVWSVEDLETAARSASSSVQKAHGIPGIGDATIHIIPSGDIAGAGPSGSLITTVDNYVTALTQFGTMPITVIGATYVPIDITATITVRSGYTSATVQNLVEFALTLATTAIDNEIIEYYEDSGIDECRTNKINMLWSWAFTSNENEALEFIINKWQSLLGARESREWSQDFELGDAWIICNSLVEFGVDIFNLTSPVTNVTVGDDEISNTGTITVSVI